MNDLVKRLRIKAGMIEMGEMIAWGSDSALMREAADVLEMAAPAVQGELAGVAITMPGTTGITVAVFDAVNVPPGTQVYTAPQPAEQQPAPDMPGLTEALRQYQHSDGSGLVFGYDRLLVDQYVAGLVVTLKSIEEWVMRYADPKHLVATVARKALAGYRKQGGEA